MWSGRAGFVPVAKVPRTKGGTPTKKKRRKAEARRNYDPHELGPRIHWRAEDEAADRQVRHAR